MHSALPSKTALRVALRRAAHQLQDHPIVFRDPLAVPILGPEYTEELRRTPAKELRPFSAAFRAFMVARAQLAEDTLAHSVIHHHTSQYLILGAGLDTFAYRNPYPNLQVFEVDHPNTQAWKQERLAAAKIPIPPTTHHVPVDFETQSLSHELKTAGFNPNLPTVTAWLGVVPYLTLEAFRDTTELLGSFAHPSTVVFDYSQPREVLGPREQLMLDSLSSRVAQAGEPFRLFFTPEALATELQLADMQVVEDLDGPTLTQRYFANRTDGLCLRGKAGRLCVAQTARTV